MHAMQCASVILFIVQCSADSTPAYREQTEEKREHCVYEGVKNEKRQVGRGGEKTQLLALYTACKHD